jgi:ribonuclease BN (tRNA processing enzyme)
MKPASRSESAARTSRFIAAQVLALLAIACSAGDRADVEIRATRDVTMQTDAGPTRVVMLGSGTPVPESQRSGPAVAVVSGGRAYLVDCGTGVVRQAQAAAEQGIWELTPSNLSIAFLTHLHSDHTLGLADLMLTPAISGRAVPLRLYGPAGLQRLGGHLLDAYAPDIELRTTGKSPLEKLGYTVEAHEIGAGPVFSDGNVNVTAFAVDHGMVADSYGYRFDAGDRSIVISGDTAPCDAVAEACSGCDLLVHEVYCKAAFDMGTPEWQEYHATHHTSTEQVAQLAKRARPKLLLLYHVLTFGAPDQLLLDEVMAAYDGDVVISEDLGTY